LQLWSLLDRGHKKIKNNVEARCEHYSPCS
jgi:hypothetical protein